MKAAGYASIMTALLLVGLKIWAWLATGSVAVLSSLVDSLLDGFASLITLYAVHQALVPADEDHRFGHGKAEPLAALAQSAFITASAIFLILQAGNRLLTPQPIERGELGLIIIGGSILLTLLLVLFQSLVIRKTGSLAITADRLHYLGDLIPNLAVIAALALTSLLNISWIDPVFGLLAALYLLKGAWQTGRTALDMLMDRELPEEIRQQVLDIALSIEGVQGLHDLRSRQSGNTSFFQLHLELSPDLPLIEAHAISDRVEQKILDQFPEAEILIHQDPHGIMEQE